MNYVKQINKINPPKSHDMFPVLIVKKKKEKTKILNTYIHTFRGEKGWIANIHHQALSMIGSIIHIFLIKPQTSKFILFLYIYPFEQDQH